MAKVCDKVHFITCMWRLELLAIVNMNMRALCKSTHHLLIVLAYPLVSVAFSLYLPL